MCSTPAGHLSALLSITAAGRTAGPREDCRAPGGLPGPGRTAGLTGGSLKSAEPTDDLKHLQRAGPVFSL